MLIHRQISRRDVLRAALVSGAVLAIPGCARPFRETVHQDELCRETPHMEEGPFYLNGYDRTRPVSHNRDLTAVPGATGLPDGEIIYVTGRITGEKYRPLEGAMVEIWQANAKGRYTHIKDLNPAPKDPNFLGFGEAVTDENGMYSFKTIKPGGYPVPGGLIRTPHIHFKVHRGMFYMIVTQKHFAGEKHNRDDFLLNSLSKAERERLIIEPSRRPGSSTQDQYRFDIALKAPA